MGDGVDVGHDCYLRGVAMDNYPTRHHTFNDDDVCYIHPKRVIHRKERLAFFCFSDPFDFHCTTTTTTTNYGVVVIASFFFARPCQLTPRGCPMKISDLTRANKKNNNIYNIEFYQYESYF